VTGTDNRSALDEGSSPYTLRNGDVPIALVGKKKGRGCNGEGRREDLDVGHCGLCRDTLRNIVEESQVGRRGKKKPDLRNANQI